MNVLVIVGQPRSGTSVLWRTIRSGRGVVGLAEPFNPKLLPKFNAGRGGFWVQDYRAAASVLTSEFAPIASESEEPLGLLSVASAVYLRNLVHARQKSARGVALKTVRCGAKINVMRRLLPGAFFVHLVRDPCAWIASHLRPYVGEDGDGWTTYDGPFDYWQRESVARGLGFCTGTPIERLAHVWSHMTSVGTREADMTITHEDFCDDPDGVVSTIAKRAFDFDVTGVDTAEVRAPNPPFEPAHPHWDIVEDIIRDTQRRFLRTWT